MKLFDMDHALYVVQTPPEDNDDTLINPDFTYKLSEAELVKFVRLRAANDALFTGKRNTSIIAWRAILKEMGIQRKMSTSQARKKWENLKKKYKMDSQRRQLICCCTVQCWSSSRPSSGPQDAAHRTLPTGRCPQDAAGWIVLEMKNPPPGVTVNPTNWQWFSLMDDAMEGRLNDSEAMVSTSSLGDDNDFRPDRPRKRGRDSYQSEIEFLVEGEESRLSGETTRDRADAGSDRDEMEQERALLESDRSALESERMVLEREKMVLDRERAGLERELAALDRDRASLEREKAAVERDRASEMKNPPPGVTVKPHENWQWFSLMDERHGGPAERQRGHGCPHFVVARCDDNDFRPEQAQEEGA
ncbi:hypothetical protein NFI96_032872 [Prochilodus magdalenae]|nr:hypothetical protein NFI96_032872 [Prochilodus magdalenae]